MTAPARPTSPPFVMNGRCLGRPVTGVERYAHEVLAHMPKSVGVVRPGRTRDGIAGHAWEQLRLPAMLPRRTLLWSPANTGPLRVRRQVVTIHDVSPLDHPEWFRPSFAAWYRFMLPRLARVVRRIITDSAFSRGRIVERLGVSPDRVVLIPCGVSRRFSPAGSREVEAVRKRYGIERPYVIAVGSLEPRKNLPTLCRAWELIRRRLPDVDLVIVGAPRFNFAASEVTGVAAGVKFLGAVPDVDLPALYTGALALIAPSLYEGFGLPALEAMACGTAVVAAAGTGLDDAVGTAAVKIDPRSVESIREAVERIIVDSPLRAAMREEGRARAQAFTWEHTAARTWAVLQEAAQE